MYDKTPLIEEIVKLLPLASFATLEFIFYYLLSWKKAGWKP